MKKFYFPLFILFVSTTQAQNIQLVSDQISFPDATEKNPSQATVEVYNSGLEAVEVYDVDLFNIYGNRPFSTVDTAFVLQPQDTQVIDVSFLPEHNIYHEMGMVIKTSSGYGHLAVNFTAQGEFSNPYYSSTENLSEEALKTALKNKLSSGYNSLGYTTARDHMYGSIDNSGGIVTCVYTGRSATFSTRSGANNNNFNCEHTFPQGKFNSNEPMRSDIHHLFPTDVQANSIRGNDPFGIVSGTPTWQNGGSKSGGGIFEPRDAHKGTAARAMMYFVIRYQDYQNFFAGQEAVLRSWHQQFPPAMHDINRNNAIAQLQNSRNPFVDYPQFVERINKISGNSVAPSVRQAYFSDDTIKLRKTSGRHNYGFVAYNSGNQVLNMSNFTFSDTSLYFPMGQPFGIQLQPGEAKLIEISFNGAVNYNADFEFDIDIPGNSHRVIHIITDESLSSSEVDMETKLNIYPNPADEVIYIQNPQNLTVQLELYNLSGQVLLKSDLESMDISDLPSGLYLLGIKVGDRGLQMEKVVVE